MKKVLITGGAGFIGSHTVDYLLEKKYKVLILDNLKTGDLNNLNLKKVTFINGDINDQKLIDQLMSKIDYVIHLAAIASVSESISDPINTHNVNVDGTLKLFESAARFKVKKVIYASSAAVYGNNQKIPISEKEKTSPISPYGLHKEINEIYADYFNKSSETKFIGLRYFNVYGPRQKINGGYPAVIPNFCLKILSNEKIKIFGDGEQFRDFIYVKDVAKINVLLLEKNIKDNILNVGTGEKNTLKRLIKIIENKTNKKAEIIFEKSRIGDIKKSLSNSDLLYKTLKIKNIDFQNGIQDTLNYYSKN